jgi:hypothetical protein
VTLRATERPIDISTEAAGASSRCSGLCRVQNQFPQGAADGGIAKAKAEGIYKGRKPSIDGAQVCALAAERLGYRHFTAAQHRPSIGLSDAWGRLPESPYSRADRSRSPMVPPTELFSGESLLHQDGLGRGVRRQGCYIEWRDWDGRPAASSHRWQ